MPTVWESSAMLSKPKADLSDLTAMKVKWFSGTLTASVYQIKR